MVECGPISSLRNAPQSLQSFIKAGHCLPVSLSAQIPDAWRARIRNVGTTDIACLVGLMWLTIFSYFCENSSTPYVAKVVDTIPA